MVYKMVIYHCINGVNQLISIDFSRIYMYFHLFIIEVRQSVSGLPLTSSEADAMTDEIRKVFSIFAIEHRICFDFATRSAQVLVFFHFHKRAKRFSLHCLCGSRV